MAILTVGSGQQFGTVKAAVAASHDGDTLYVQAGTYLNDSATINTKISIVGVGGMAHFVGNQPLSNGKAFLVTNTDVTLDHVEFSGATDADNNGAGIRYQGGNLTITNSYSHNNQDGLLASTYSGGAITIQNSEFAHNGAGDGLSHNLYVNEIGTLTVTNSYFHDANVGHELKSRAANTVLLNDRFVDGTSTASYSIDLPNSGNATIKNDIIQQGPNSQNPGMISYGAEITKPQWASSSLLVQSNTFVNQLNTLSARGVVNHNNLTASLVDNHFYGLTATQIASGSNVQTGDTMLSTAPAISTAHPYAKSPWDDLISGGAGNDTLNGTAKHDLFVGGAGNDTFVIASGGNSDTIADFAAGATTSDVVKLVGYGLSTLSGVVAAMTQHGADVLLNLGNGETLTLQNHKIVDFVANDFSFSNSLTTTFQSLSLTSTSQTVTTSPDSFTFSQPAAPTSSADFHLDENLSAVRGLMDGAGASGHVPAADVALDAAALPEAHDMLHAGFDAIL
jgi:Ca2+-binding RTX toxin-like protein